MNSVIFDTVPKNIFFVYGGIAISSDSIKALSDAIDNLRLINNIPTNYKLKFNPGPEGMKHDDFAELKKQIVKIAIEHHCILFTSFILHDIATSPADARRNEINRICFHFCCYLHRVNSHGLVLIDQFTDKEIDHHLREKFSVGLTGLPYAKTMRLDNIVGFHYSAIGQSNMCSIVDVVLGSLRFAVNAHNEQDIHKKETAKKLLELISPMFFRETGKESISEIGMFFSPKIVKTKIYREQYEKLHRFICDAGLNIEQQITDQRTY